MCGKLTMFGVATRGEHHDRNVGESWVLTADIEEFKAVHIWHFDITNYQFNVGDFLPEDLQCFLTIFSLEGAVAIFFEGEAETLAGGNGVIDDEH